MAKPVAFATATVLLLTEPGCSGAVRMQAEEFQRYYEYSTVQSHFPGRYLGVKGNRAFLRYNGTVYCVPLSDLDAGLAQRLRARGQQYVPRE